MNVTIIGTGKMAHAIGTRLVAGGNSVTFVGRQAEKATALASEVGRLATHGAAARAADPDGLISNDIVVLAVPYGSLKEVVEYYQSQLAGKTIVDITNPLKPTPEGLESAAPPGTSAAEQVAAMAPPGARVVKAFNTAFAATVAAGKVAGQPLDIFIAGDDAAAKSTVAGLIEAGGMRAIDAGPLRRARQLEGMALIIIALQETMGTNYMSAWKLVW